MSKTRGNTRLTPHFKRSEVVCRCGCGRLPPQRALEKLEELRMEFGGPLVITSGARCGKRNKEVGGSVGSYHLKGLAFDIQCVSGPRRRRLLEAAIRVGFTGIGLARSFIHVDLRPEKQATTWFYS